MPALEAAQAEPPPRERAAWPHGFERRGAGRGLAGDVIDLFPYGIMVCDRGGRIVAANACLQEIAARDRAPGELATTCCALLGCGRVGGPLEASCLTVRAIAAGERLPEIELSLPMASAGSMRVTAAPLYEDRSHVVFEIRPDRQGSLSRERLRIFSLGRFRVEGAGGPLSGDWLEQRPGQLLRFLVCERRRVAPVDLIGEAIWPHSGAAASNTVRHFIHGLRSMLEPGRPKGADSFVVCRSGGYTLHAERIWIDADEFENAARGGMAAFARGSHAVAREHLERAVALYEGDFLSEQPYADWAHAERERLRAVAYNALRTLAELSIDHSTQAAIYLERLAEMEPFDNDVHRQLITTWLNVGRKSRAARHYHSFRVRLLREFGEPPDFELLELARLPESRSLEAAQVVAKPLSGRRRPSVPRSDEGGRGAA
jgi:DNA-binding SARP family transcriptional activator